MSLHTKVQIFAHFYIRSLFLIKIVFPIIVVVLCFRMYGYICGLFALHNLISFGLLVFCFVGGRFKSKVIWFLNCCVFVAYNSGENAMFCMRLQYQCVSV
jgi:hypothetical protein